MVVKNWKKNARSIHLQFIITVQFFHNCANGSHTFIHIIGKCLLSNIILFNK